MNLCIDIGNSRTKIGAFQGTQLLEKVTVPTLSESDVHALSEKYRPEAAIWSNVAGNDDLHKCFSRVSFPVLELQYDTPLPFTSQYTTPETLGRDRLAAVAGALSLYPGTDCLVIDLGTCIKYEFFEQKRRLSRWEYCTGCRNENQGNESFHGPPARVNMKMPVSPIGHSTETALQNGALLGALLEMKGYIELIQATFPGTKVILSGGDAAFFASQPALGNNVIQPDLILHGLNSILNHNQFKDNSTPT